MVMPYEAAANSRSRSARRHERPMPERDLAAVTDQDVQTHDHDGEDQHQSPLARLEARDHGWQSDEEEDENEHEPVTRRSVPHAVLKLFIHFGSQRGRRGRSA